MTDISRPGSSADAEQTATSSSPTASAGTGSPAATGSEARPTLRSVTLERTRLGHYVARNSRGGEISIGSSDNEEFSPVELLLAAIAGCASIDVDHITAKRAEPTTLLAVSSGDKVQEGAESLMRNLRVEFTVAFPEGEDGDKARGVLAQAIQMSQDRLCTVSRTLANASSVTMTEAGSQPGQA